MSAANLVHSLDGKSLYQLNLFLIQKAKENILSLYPNPIQFLTDHDVLEHQIEQRAGEGWTTDMQLHDYLEEQDNPELIKLANLNNEVLF